MSDPANPAVTNTDAWQPSDVQRERDVWRRRRTVRSAVIAAVSTLVLVGGLGTIVVLSPGWERVQQTYFHWPKAVDSFPRCSRACGSTSG